MFIGNKIERQKSKFRNAYVKYVRYVQSLDCGCGETLANYISITAYRLKQKLIKEHKKMKELDPECPSLPSLDSRLLQ